MDDDKSKKNLTILGSDTEFDGVLEFSDTVLITGKFHGTITATGDLEIDKTAVCTVDTLTAKSIVVSGSLTGTIHADERIEMCAGSKVLGDVETAHLRIADNVNFEGQVAMLETIPDVDLFSIASNEFKQALILKSDEAH
jgi:cytoskeletal protein CcmA (bactofilin family)